MAYEDESPVDAAVRVERGGRIRTPAERTETEQGLLRDPAVEDDEFYRAYHEATAEAILEMDFGEVALFTR